MISAPTTRKLKIGVHVKTFLGKDPDSEVVNETAKVVELLKARLALRESLPEVGDFVAYCDVSQHHDLDAKPVRGVLFALAARQLMGALARQNFAGACH